MANNTIYLPNIHTSNTGTDVGGKHALDVAIQQSALPAGAATEATLAANNNGFTQANAPVRWTYTTPVTTLAWTQLVASLANTTKEIEIFDSSGQTLMLATGVANDPLINIFPGGNGRVRISIPAGTRVSVKAVSADATVGELIINWYK